MLLRARRGAVRTATTAAAAASALFAFSAPGLLHAQTPDSTRAGEPAGATGREAPAAHPADVAFMRGMILHHQQALDMSELIPGRNDDPRIALLGERIIASQKYEIRLMRSWLGARGESADMDMDMAEMHRHMEDMAKEDEAARDSLHAEHGAEHEAMHAEHEAMHADHEAMHADHEAMHAAHHPPMAGMATPEQMAELAASSGADFDRMFLTLMIRHHEGALTMVQDLRATEGGGLDPELFQLTDHIEADQRAEIARMRTMLEAM